MVNHPNIIPGTGLEDFGALERVFSASNQLANQTRYATAYHRRAFIHMFAAQWDEEKYQNLGTMLYNNYRQALQIITEESLAVEEAKRSLSIQDGDIERWHEEQLKYFATLGKEADWDLHAMAYVELLQELRDHE